MKEKSQKKMMSTALNQFCERIRQKYAIFKEFSYSLNEIKFEFFLYILVVFEILLISTASPKDI